MAWMRDRATKNRNSACVRQGRGKERFPDFCRVFSGCQDRHFGRTFRPVAHVAELADAHGSGPCGATHGGSSPLVSRSLQGRKTDVDENLAQKNPEFVKRTFSSIATRYDFANRLLSGGLDVLWRKKLAARVAANAPRDILDLATGSGDLALALRKSNPEAVVVAADFCLPMLAVARRKGVPNLVQADGLALPFANASFDTVTVAFGLRNMADWGLALEEMRRVLRPGGVVYVMDFSLPESELVLPFYRFYLHSILPWLANMATGRREAYEYLGGSIEEFPSGLAMNALMKARGFSCEPPQSLAFGAVTIYCGRVPASDAKARPATAPGEPVAW